MKHPHSEMIIEWANDTSKVFQVYLNKGLGDNAIYGDCNISDIIVDVGGTFEFRFKPREFKVGDWHPIAVKDESFLSGFVAVYTGKGFAINGFEFSLDDIKVGDSIGAIDFSRLI